MRKVYMFNMISLDGFFEGPNHDISWHHVDEEFNDFAIQQLNETDAILFGRVTYQMMASFWPTQYAIETDPIVAEKMNSIPKYVISKTLDKADWSHTTLIKANVADEIAKLKQHPGKDLAIFGSSDLATSVMEMGLLDELRIIVNPVVLGGGKALFQGIREKVELKLLKSSAFRSGNLLLYYEPQIKRS